MVLHKTNRISARRARAWLSMLGLSAVMMGLMDVSAREKSADYNSTVAAGKWTGIEFRNMNKGAEFSVVGKTSGTVKTMIFAREALAGNPSGDKAIATIDADGLFKLAIVIPADNDYYLVFDNRSSEDAVEFELTARTSIDNY